MRTIDELANEIAEKYHKGQTRKDGKEYITHPRAVSSIVATMYKPELSYGTGLPLGNELPSLKAAALLHDVLEDCDITYNELRELLLAEFPTNIVDPLMVCLDVLNKDNYLTYCTYIVTIHIAGLFPITIKLGDLEHNTSDLTPSTMKDKYELAYYLLTR